MQQLPYMDVSINDLISFLFLANKDDAKVEMSLDGIEHNKDMFMFCLDIFCKGLVVLYSDGTNHVELTKLTLENFDFVRCKMRNAGIDVFLEIDQDTKQTPASLNFDHILALPNDLDVDKYHFEIRTPDGTYKIHFKLFHNA